MASSKSAEQVVPQAIPAGALVTTPLPVPVFVTLSRRCGCITVTVTLGALVDPQPTAPVTVRV